MMKTRLNISIVLYKCLLALSLLLFLVIISCEKERLPIKETVIGQISVDLDANKSHVRSEESLIGNMLADALVENGILKGQEVDFAILGGGGIRFDAEKRPAGIYPAGDITNIEIEEILPFFNYEVIVELTGTELKSIFERSAAEIGNGAFLQVSGEVVIFIDPFKQPQLLDNSVFPEQIALEGSRVDSVLINGMLLLPNAVYRVATTNFLALGGDQNIVLYELDDAKRIYTEDFMTSIIEEYVKANSPVTPILEGRIIFN